ncbi:MAG: glycosyl hydrolase [bacterium]|nr:glycosyl hydrolase [bacterium]
MGSRLGFAILLFVCLMSPGARAGEPGDKDAADGPRMSAKSFEGLELRSIGPALMSGRIADIAIHPKRQSTWYVAVGSGNLWKTTNAGTTWKPIFEDQGSYSLGCITLDPSNPEVVWLGTGENVGGRHVGYGDGIYRSRNGGTSWERVGLEKSEHIGRILVDPRNSDVVLVACQGPLWSAGGERGLYKTTDGGKTWRKRLGGGPYTGVNDVIADPRNPDVLYASTHQRLRNVAALVNGGPESAIHKSEDGGETWRRLEKGLPEEQKGRIGLGISPHEPDVVYATIELAHRKGGFWRSADGGGSWEKRSDEIAGATGPHYYQELFPSPHSQDRVYMAGMKLKVTEDGGKTFRSIGTDSKHVDNHALAFNPNDSEYLLAGCDGGLYESFDLGKTWKYVSNLPITQFYKVAVDYAEPFYNVYGGTQDNNTQGGPSRTTNVHGIRNSDWFITLWGDGHQPAADPTNPNIIYSEWQVGNLVRFDRSTGEFLYIQPQPAADEPWDRFNWDAPILISAHDPARLYFASQRVWRTDDRGDSWRALSGDLSRGLDRFKLPMMGRIQGFDALWDLYAMSKFGTITSLAESPLDENVLYAGTDDGLIQVSEDGGATWRKVDTLPGVDPEFFVNDIKADLFDRDAAYVCVDHHKHGDFKPYVLRTTDRGRTWSSIASDLPRREIVWRLVQDHVKPGLFFVGTEMGVFFSVDAGAHWIELEGGMPNIPVRDLVIQKRENDLVCATFGRSFYILDDYSSLRSVSEAALEQEAELFPVRKAWWYQEEHTLGFGKRASQGDAFFVAPNPDFGATFTYYLKDELRSRKDARRKTEKELEKKDVDTPYPGWEALRKEETEQKPAILLTVTNEEGVVVRRIEGPVEAGFHRVAWDLRHPPTDALTREEPDEEAEHDDGPTGFLAHPGRYTVSIAKRIDGRITDLGKSQTFDVVPLRTGTLPGAPLEVVSAFKQELAEMGRVVSATEATIKETKTRLSGMRRALAVSTVDASLFDSLRGLTERLDALGQRLSGNHRRNLANDPGPIAIKRRLSVAHMGNRHSTYGPTPTHRQSLQIAKEALARLSTEFKQLLHTDIPALESKLEAAGVPWSAGRR